VKVLEKLRDRSIIKVKHAFLLVSSLVIIMEYASGGELKQYLLKSPKLQEQEARSIFIQLLNAMQYCHIQGVIHRDLKPENILFADRSMKQIKIADFGIAGLIVNSVAEKSKAGSLKYMAPEIITEENIDSRPSIDVWSMGCILYAMLCKMLPFNGKTISEIIQKIKTCSFSFPQEINLSKQVKDLIRKMLELDYNKRITLVDIRNHPWIEGEPLEYSFQQLKAPNENEKIEENKVGVKVMRSMPIRGPFRFRNKNSCFYLPKIERRKKVTKSNIENSSIQVNNDLTTMVSSRLSRKSELNKPKVIVLKDPSSFIVNLNKQKEVRGNLPLKGNTKFKRCLLPRTTRIERCKTRGNNTRRQHIFM